MTSMIDQATVVPAAPIEVLECGDMRTDVGFALYLSALELRWSDFAAPRCVDVTALGGCEHE